MDLNVNWVSASERLPTLEDANLDEFVWGFPTCGNTVGVTYWENFYQKGTALKYWAKMEFPEPPTL